MRRFVVVAWVVCICTQASAAGFYLAPRGVRALARGGAFVAGADDVNALSYNPAGLAWGGTSILVDAAAIFHTTVYERRVFATSEPAPTVKGKSMGLPSPTVGVAYALSQVPGLVLGAGLSSDYPLLQNWPATLDDGAPAPQRYAIVNYSGTLIAKAEVGAAYRVSPIFSVGATAQLLFGTFAATMVASNCDGAICTQPENPSYDSTIQMIASGIALPGVQVGVTLAPLPWLRAGLAWESGYHLNKDAELRVRLPIAAIYEEAVVSPNEPHGRVALRLPMQLRAGIEARFDERLVIESACTFEPWSVHDAIEIDASQVEVQNLTAIGDYRIGKVRVERGFRDTWSVRLGAEGRPWLGAFAWRAGVMYEPSAVPERRLTAMNVDLDKFLVALGASYAFGALTIDVSYAHVFMAAATVTQGSSLQLGVTRPPWEGRTPIGNGTYSSSADILGFGARFSL